MKMALEEQLEKLQREVSLLEIPYTMALKRERGEDQEWETKKRVMIDRMCNLILKYKLGDEMHKAVAIVAEAGVLASELLANSRIIQEYKEKKQMLQLVVKDIELRQKHYEEIEAAARKSPWMRNSA